MTSAVGAVKQKAKTQMQLAEGGSGLAAAAVGGGTGGKTSSFQFWRWVVLLMVIGSTLAIGMWGLLTGLGDFIAFQEGSPFLTRASNVFDLSTVATEVPDSAHCLGRRVYMYVLPPQFNAEVLKTLCFEKNDFMHYCQSFINGGFGERMEHVMEPLEAWWRTEQYGLEPILHERFKQYQCLTDNPDIADLFYLPYYGGLDLSVTIYSSKMQLRDMLVERLLGWLVAQPTWIQTKGNNHFIALSRIYWDFSRQKDINGWGNSMLSSFEFINVTKVLIERDPNSMDERLMAIPYPTSFHPQSDLEIEIWQKKLAESKRDALVSFAAAPRNATEHPEMAVRDILFEQCKNSDRCKSLSCHEVDCVKNPHFITNLFLQSNFCFQPPGDSPTRKAVFDCMVAGSIPVFFSKDTAYTQYLWHLPEDGSSYSVLIDEMQLIEKHEEMNAVDILAQIPDSRIKEMQAVIREKILPCIVYDMPGRDRNKKAKDSFDITLEHIFNPNFRAYPSPEKANVEAQSNSESQEQNSNTSNDISTRS